MAAMRRAWIVTGVVTATLTVGSVAVASQARTPGEIAARAGAPSPSEITVAVTRDTLVRTVQAGCERQARTTVALGGSAATGGETPIVTGLPVKDGGTVKAGQVAIELSGRPVIVLAGRLPVFREMRPGTSGPDVRQLQRALAEKGWLSAGRVDGLYGPSTSAGVERMYTALGYAPTWTSPQARSALRDGLAGVEAARAGLNAARKVRPADPDAETAAVTALAQAESTLGDLREQEGTVVARGELLFVPTAPAELDRGQLSLGAPAGEDTGAALTSGDTVLVCTLADIDPALVKTGAPVTVAGLTRAARVSELRTTTAGAGNDGSSGPVTLAVVDLPKTDTGGVADPAASVQIQVAKAPRESLVVPVSALWERPGGQTVVEVLRDAAFVEVPVTVDFQANGLAAITPASDTQLATGDTVRVGATS